MVDKNSRLIDLTENTDAQFWKVAFDKLTEPEQTFVCVWELEGEVNNGGFTQYYGNSAGANAESAPPALDRIGAHAMADIARRANSVFPNAAPPVDATKREDILEEAGESNLDILGALDDEFYEYPDDLIELLYAYVTEHRQQIRGAKCLESA